LAQILATARQRATNGILVDAWSATLGEHNWKHRHSLNSGSGNLAVDSPLLENSAKQQAARGPVHIISFLEYDLQSAPVSLGEPLRAKWK
jgi:hypothetical protein